VFRSAYADVVIPNRSLSDFVLGAAHEHSAKPALVDNSTGLVLTYAQLLDRVRRAASGLAALGIGKGDVVALSAPNSPEFAVAFHAVVRLGAVVTPINPANTSHEIAHQLDASGAKVLVAAISLADKAHTAIRETGRPLLSVITAGPHPPNAADLLTGPRLAELIKRLEERFDHVIVDSPPVIGLADAPLVGAAVDGIIFVVEARAVQAGAAMRALQRLETAQATVLGIVLTKFEPRQAHLGYGYGYGFDYGYGQ